MNRRMVVMNVRAAFVPSARSPLGQQLTLIYGGLTIAAIAESGIVVGMHRLAGKETPVLLAASWVLATMSVWAIVAPSVLHALHRIRSRTTREGPYLLGFLAVGSIAFLAATGLRASFDLVVPALGHGIADPIDVWRAYILRWTNPAALFLVMIALLHRFAPLGTRADARPEMAGNVPPEAPVAAASDLASCESSISRGFIVRVGQRSVTVPLASILWMRSEGNYLALYTPSGVFLARATMTETEAILDRDVWLRVHRSAIVRIDAVVGVRRERTGALKAVLSDGRTVPVSRICRVALENRLGVRG